jgi:uncharacterized protein
MKRVLAASTLVCGLSLSAGAQAQTPTVSITILTSAQSGAYHALGVALSQIYAQVAPKVKATAQVTKAPVDSLNLLQAGRGELAFAPADVLAGAWRGDEEAGFKTPLKNLRGLSATYDNHVHIVARAESGIRTVADLKGKRLSVGTPRSTTELVARAMVRAAGLTYKDFAKIEYLPFGQSVELMKDRQIDAMVQSAVVGAVSIRDLATAVKIVVVAIPLDVVAKTGDGYKPATITANSYPGQTTDVPTAAIPNFLVTQSEVPDDLAYEMTKALYDHLDKLSAASSAAKTIRRDNALAGMPVPLHPGAEKYYQEVGVIK